MSPDSGPEGEWVVTAHDLRLQHKASAGPYWEFLRIPPMSVGHYRLAAGESDLQTPHAEDEIYVGLEGHARLMVGKRTYSMGPGSVAFVPRRAEHRFFSVGEPFEVLVLFAPAESSTGPSPGA